MKLHGCYTSVAVPHPWEDIKDVACGYEKRMQDSCCEGCHRRREEGPEDQLRELNAMGRAAKSLKEAQA